MYTLYQGLQSIMPKTAYLKFIDIFLLYGLIVPFITFTVEVVSKLLGGKEASNENENEVPRREKIRQALKYTSEKIIPLFTAMFLGVYSYLAVYYYIKG